MSPRRCRAEDGVGGGVAGDVAVGVTERSLLEGDRHAADDERAAIDQTVQIVAGADAIRASGRTPPLLRRACPRGRQIFFGRDLHVAGVPLDDMDNVTGALGERRFVGGLDAGPGRGNRVRQYIATKALRCLCQVDLLPRDRAGDHPTGADTFHRIARGYRRDRRAVRGRGIDGAVDQVSRHERTCCIVDQHDVGGGADGVERIGHGILSPFPADRHPHIRRLSRGALEELKRDRRPTGQHDDNLIDPRMPMKRRHGVLEHRLAANIQQLFRLAGAEAPSGSSSGDDGGDVHGVNADYTGRAASGHGRRGTISATEHTEDVSATEYTDYISATEDTEDTE